MLEITPMAEADIDFGVSLTDHENWGYLPGDFKRLIRISPEGCFVAREDGQRAAIITSIRYDDFAFVGTLITSEKSRGKGIGETLMRHAIETLRRQGANYFEIDAVFPAISLYRRLGFKDKYLSLRFAKPSSMERRSGEGVKDRKEFTVDLLDFDRQLTGLNRSELLGSYYSDSLYFACSISANKPTGFAFLIPCQGNKARLASLVGINRDIAERLFAEILEANQHLTILGGIPEINQDAAHMFRDHGFIYRQPSVRMFLGEKRVYEHSIYTIASADKG